MLRSAARLGVFAVRQGVLTQRALPAIGSRSFSASVDASEAEIEAYFLELIKRPDLDGWQLRQAINDIHRRDMVPNPEICTAVLRTCRRLNDYALTTRFLEALRFKTQTYPELYKFVLNEIKPVMEELGISSVEELGYDKPELWLKYPDDSIV